MVAKLSGRWVAAAAMAAFAFAQAPGRARGDVITLRGGGQVQGKVVPDPSAKDRVQVLMMTGRKPLSLQRAQILDITPKSSPLDEYIVKRGKADKTAQAQYDLGAWCEQNKLVDLSRLHYEAALSNDKSFEPAHKKLGHVYKNGYWVTRDDLKAMQGLVKYKGRWITPEEMDNRLAEEKLDAARASWQSRIKMMRQAIVSGPTNRRREAEIQLMAIRDPDAVVPLVRVLAKEEPPLRILLAEVLAAIPESAATAAMVKMILAEPTGDVRAVIFEKLKDRERPGVLKQLVRALSSSDITVINRAAWTLGNLGDAEVVPRLIPALLTTELHVIMVTPGASGNQGSVSGPALPGAPLAANNSALALQTPPAVSQGAVAFGATVVPFYQLPGNVSTPPGTQIPQPEPRVVPFTYQNVEVLAALQKLTGQDFGYDIPSWKGWLAHKFNPNPKPSRRVRQPLADSF
jgi:HEAT repeats